MLMKNYRKNLDKKYRFESNLSFLLTHNSSTKAEGNDHSSALNTRP